MKPISLVPAPKYLAKKERVGDLNMVELKMAVAPMKERSRNLVDHLLKNSSLSTQSPYFSGTLL